MTGIGGTRATVIITVTWEDLLDRLGHGTTSDGTSISVAEVLRLANEGGRHHPGGDESGRAPLELGRTPTDRGRGPNPCVDRPGPRLLLPRLRPGPGMVRTTPHHRMGRRRNHRPGQPDPGMSLPPPQLRRPGLEMPDQSRPATRMGPTPLDRPHPTTLDQQPNHRPPRQPTTTTTGTQHQANRAGHTHQPRHPAASTN